MTICCTICAYLVIYLHFLPEQIVVSKIKGIGMKKKKLSASDTLFVVYTLSMLWYSLVHTYLKSILAALQ